LLFREEGRDDAGDAAAVRQHRACQLAHEAESAAAVDEADAVSGHDGPELARGTGVSGVGADVRAAVDADVADAALARRAGLVCFLHLLPSSWAAVVHTLHPAPRPGHGEGRRAVKRNAEGGQTGAACRP